MKKTFNVVNGILLKIKENNVTAFSAQAAFFIIIAFFPFIMFLLTMIQYLPFTEANLVSIIGEALPDSLDTYVVSLISEVYSKANGAVISFAVLSSLWSASRAFLAVVTGLDSVYSVKETRDIILVRFLCTLYTAVFAMMLIASLGIFVFGNRIFLTVIYHFPFLHATASFVKSVRTIGGFVILFLFFLILYVFVPNRKTYLKNEAPGAVLAAIGWMGFSYIFSYYIDLFGKYSYMYGSLTTIVLLMLWLYFCMYIMFVGAEVNMALIRARINRELNRPVTK